MKKRLLGKTDEPSPMAREQVRQAGLLHAGKVVDMCLQHIVRGGDVSLVVCIMFSFKEFWYDESSSKTSVRVT